ncbi:MAG: amino acid ABC transporter permease [Deltaproteobacteria bacterium]|jgi:polar amino acid transport system permease protein|nr:amino acid ABC transporter permease [Deltaproteobacteria bacterium]
MELSYIVKFAPAFLKAIVLTAELAALGIAAALALGAAAAVAIYHRTPALDKLASAYVELARNTPLMIQLFFLYFGLPRAGVRLDAATCAVIGLAFLGGGYMAESIRGGLEAVGKSQIESGLCIGLTRLQLMRHVVWPQALAAAMPSLSANAIFLIKETSVFSVVALADIMYVANDLMMEGHSNETNLMMVTAYLVLIFPVSLICSWGEKKVRSAGFGG